MGYFSLESTRCLYFTVSVLLISGLHKIAFFFFKTLEVEGTLNKNIVQSRHFFLLNIEINKRVPFFLSLSVSVVISIAEQIPL